MSVWKRSPLLAYRTMRFLSLEHVRMSKKNFDKDSTVGRDVFSSLLFWISLK